MVLSATSLLSATWGLSITTQQTRVLFCHPGVELRKSGVSIELTALFAALHHLEAS